MPPSEVLATVRYPVRQVQLDNGVRVVVVPRPESESVAMALRIPRAGGLAGGPLTALGEALRAGSTTRSGEPIYDPKINGSAIRVWSDWWDTELNWYLLPSAKWKALELFADFVQRPSFEPQMSVRYLHSTYEESRRATRYGHWDSRAIAALPHGIPWIPFGERARRVSQFPPRDLGSLHDCTFRPQGATLVLAGEIDPAEGLVRARRLFGDWKRSTTDPSRCTPNESRALMRHEATALAVPYVEVDDGPEDPRVALAFEGPGPRSPDFFAFEALTELLSAEQSSEHSPLRHAGQSYGMAVTLAYQSPGVSALVLQGQIRKQGAVATLAGLVRSVRNIADGLTAAKLEALRRRLLVRRLQYLTTNLNVVSIVLHLLQAGLDPTEPDSWSYPVVSVADCQRLADRFLKEAAPSIVAATSLQGFERELKAAFGGE